MIELKNQASLAQEKILDLAKQFGVNHGSPTNKEVGKNSSPKEEKNLEEEKNLKVELVELTQKLNQEMHRLSMRVSFQYDETIQGLLVKVKDADGDQIIREIPSKEAIELMKKMRDLIGAIFDKRG